MSLQLQFISDSPSMHYSHACAIAISTVNLTTFSEIRFSLKIIVCAKSDHHNCPCDALMNITLKMHRDRPLIISNIVLEKIQNTHFLQSCLQSHACAGAAPSSLGSAAGCSVEGRTIDTALGQCFIPNSSH